MLKPTNVPVDGHLGTVVPAAGGLFFCYADTPNTTHDPLTPLGPQRIVGRFSSDAAQTWSQPRVLVECDAAPGVVSSPIACGDAEGRLNVLWLRFYTYGVLTPETARCEVWHAGSVDNGQIWSKPVQVDFGHTYTGALNSMLRLSSGRLLAPLSYIGANKTGKFVSMAVYSDDNGATWHGSETDLAGAGEGGEANMGENGMIEPVVVELASGRVWMLVRTTLGRLYSSFSDDAGANWARPEPTQFETSNSPAGILRLHDGRLVIVWNNCNGEPLLGGVSYDRHALHAAISTDDGVSWTNPAELVRKADDESVHAQYCYPFLVESAPGQVLVMYHCIGTHGTVEGEGWSNPLRKFLQFDADWLCAEGQ